MTSFFSTHTHRLRWQRDFNVSTSIQPLTSIELCLTDLHAHFKVFSKANYEEVAQPVLSEVFLQPSTAVALLFSSCTVPALLSQCSNYRIWQFFMHYYILFRLAELPTVESLHWQTVTRYLSFYSVPWASLIPRLLPLGMRLRLAVIYEISHKIKSMCTSSNSVPGSKLCGIPCYSGYWQHDMVYLKRAAACVLHSECD